MFNKGQDHEEAVSLQAVEVELDRCRREISRLADEGALSTEEQEAMTGLREEARSLFGTLRRRDDLSLAGCIARTESLCCLDGMLKMLAADIDLAHHRFIALQSATHRDELHQRPE